MEGISSFSWKELRSSSTQLGEDGKEGQTFSALTPKAFRGQVLDLAVNVPKGTRVAVKTFKRTKSANKLSKEAGHQQQAAIHGAAPPIYGVNRPDNYIVMQCLSTLVVNEYRDQPLPEALQYMICALMNRLDAAKVMQSDMNALNVMLDEGGRPYIIDYGMAKTITPTILQKRAGHPNVQITLWGLVRGFQRYKIEVAILDACVKSDNPTSFFERGEQALENLNQKVPKRRKRRQRHLKL
jgi:RIO-like serine/threonine protein kinase